MDDLNFLKNFNKENSTQNEKIRRISQTLQQMNIENKHTTPQKSIDQIELRLHQLEEKFENFKEFDEKRFRVLTESVEGSKKVLEREKKSEQEMFEDFRNGFEFWQNETSQKIQNMGLSSGAFESEVVDNIVHNLLKSTTDELTLEENKLEETKNEVFKNIKCEVEKNKDILVEISNEQDQLRTEIMEIFEKESKFISDKIMEYKVSKKEVEETIFGLVKEFVEKTQEEIENEHRERVKQEDQILNLLDKATTKLNHLSKI